MDNRRKRHIIFTHALAVFYDVPHYHEGDRELEMDRYIFSDPSYNRVSDLFYFYELRAPDMCLN